MAVAIGCRLIGPSNHRTWESDQAELSYSRFEGSLVAVHNIRNCAYRTPDDYTVSYYDKTFDLAKLDTVDFIIVPFNGRPEGAHTMLSFGFAGKDYVTISVEGRREKGEPFSVLKSLADGYELIYVVGDERDLIQLRSNLRLDDVYLYRMTATPEQIRPLFVDMLKRANALREHPEFYHLVTNNCITNIMTHINNVTPGRVPYTYEVLFSGYSDRLAYRLGLIPNDKPFERLRLESRINKLAYIYRESPDFSQRIRQ